MGNRIAGDIAEMNADSSNVGNIGNARKTSYSFSGHQTFPFRYGWLKKAVDAVIDDPKLFARDDAIAVLGVGKNMVQSIRHWGLATRMLDQENQSRDIEVSQWGRLLLLDGYDPYLEDPGSLWLLHWLLTTNPARAATWYIAFNHFPYPSFQKSTLATFTNRFARRNELRANERTIDRDIDCFLRTYAASRETKGSTIEDSFSCPLVELEILHHDHDGDGYRFAIGPKTTLPNEVVGVALLNFFESRASSHETLSVQDCLYGAGSPGQIFRLDESSLLDYINAVEQLTDRAIAVDETAGISQVYRRSSFDPGELLQTYYLGNSA